MVSVGVSKLGYTDLIFVDPGVKVNGAYYRDVSWLKTAAAIDALCVRKVLYISTGQRLLTYQSSYRGNAAPRRGNDWRTCHRVIEGEDSGERENVLLLPRR
jgi:hypothetical protein